MSMKYLFVIVILFCGFGYGNAQTIKGIVCDKDTKEPIPYVYVYLDGTSVNTLTDTLGRFRLETKSMINTKLVLLQVAYETYIIDQPFKELPDTLFLTEKVTSLGEVEVAASGKPDPFTRDQKMRAFREQFLLYKCRWSIETCFKKLKQNFQLTYFYSDTENGIKTQVWCTLIAYLLLQVIQTKTASKKAFSTIAALIRIHLISLLDLDWVVTEARRGYPKRSKSRNKSPSVAQLSLF